MMDNNVKEDSIAYKNALAWRGCEKLYLDERTADVFFVFDMEYDQSKKVPAHKNILSAISRVFDAMFYGAVKEEGDINIIDSTPEAFKEFLQFFYRSSVKLTTENVAEVMNLGKKYELNDCLNTTAYFYEATLTLDNVCGAYELAILFDQLRLKQVCEQKIIENPKEVFRSSSFLNCESNLLRHILQLNSLNCDETVVFDGCLAWAKAACIRNSLDEENAQNLRSQLNDLFYEIRFGEMKIEDFYARHRKYNGLFSLEEFNEFGMSTKNDIRLGKFNRIPRTSSKLCRNKDLLVCDRIDSVSDFEINFKQISNSNTMCYDRLLFTSNHLLLLKSFICSEVFNYENLQCIPAMIKVSEVSDTGYKNRIFGRQILFKSTCETVVEVPSPIIIRPDMKYEITVGVGNRNAFNYLTHKPEVKMQDGIIIQFYDNKYANDKEGLVTRLHFIRHSL